MPYALTNLVHGEVPSAFFILDAADAPAGSLVVADANYDPAWIWDDTAKVLRAKTATERVNDLKAAKKAEFESAASLEMNGVMPVYQALIKLSGNSLGIDPRLQKLSEIENKKARGFAQIDGKTLEQLQNFTWWDIV